MGGNRKKLGKWGEAQAVSYLEKKGYRILDRNVYTPYGELDIIAAAGDSEKTSVVFVEVKTRTSRAFGFPEDAVDNRKMDHILGAASHYIQEHPQLGEHWQVDVIAVERYTDGEEPEIYHFNNVVS